MNDGTTPLILAARLAVEGMVAELINCQADVNAVDDHGRSADSHLQGAGCNTVLRDPSQIQIRRRVIYSFIHSFVHSF